MEAVTVERGDITLCAVDAIVNAAKRSLLGGAGVDGAIHSAAGPDLLAACREIPEVSLGVRCPTGEARITPGFNLPAPWVIHTVGPIYEDPAESAAELAQAHRNSLQLAVDRNLRSVAFPAISCGIYGFPVHEAAAVAAEVAQDDWDLDEIRFVLFEDGVHAAWLSELS